MLVTCLQDIAIQVGANRILRTVQGAFHHPFGVIGMDPERERSWRCGAVAAALKTLQAAVEGPTVFDF